MSATKQSVSYLTSLLGLFGIGSSTTPVEDETIETTTDPAYVGVAFDISGSMGMFNADQIKSGLLGMLSEQGDISRIVLHTFNGIVTNAFDGVELTREVLDECFVPNGCTAMNDAFCATIKSAQSDPSSKKIVILLTDGDENGSKEFTLPQTRDLIQQALAEGIVILSLGISPRIAGKYGLPVEHCIEFHHSDRGMTTVMSAAADLLRSHTNEEYEGDREFTVEQRMNSSQAPPLYESGGESLDLSRTVVPRNFGGTSDLSTTLVPEYLQDLRE